MSDINNSSKALRHIAFIMDGNGRWAKAKGLPREAGHKAGAEALKRVLKRCGELDIDAVTVYAFSTENWKRPKKEVDMLMELLYTALASYSKEMMKNGLRFKAIGDKSAFSDKLRCRIDEIEELTKANKKYLNVALNYGGRDEIVHACNKLIKSGRSNISEADISAELYTADCPDPDLIVRTSGELRLSNFLIWQAAYSEFYFTDTLWPDMDGKEVDKAINAYMSRQRRFGGLT